MKRVFISVPMHGKTLNEISDAIKDTIKVFSESNEFDFGDNDFEFVNTLEQTPPDVEVVHERVWYLGKALELLSTCDMALFCHGWSYARGCLVEQVTALTYGIPMYGIDGHSKLYKLEK